MTDTYKDSIIDWSVTLWSDMKGTGWGTGWLIGATTEIGIFTLLMILLVLLCGSIRIGELMAKRQSLESKASSRRELHDEGPYVQGLLCTSGKRKRFRRKDRRANDLRDMYRARSVIQPTDKISEGPPLCQQRLSAIAFMAAREIADPEN
jgi:hypothetical protein